MKARLPILATLFFGLATAASGTIITFEAAPVGLLASYTESGVTFTSVGGGLFDAVATPNGTRGLLEESTPRSTLRADIAGGADTVSIDLGDFNADPDLLFLEIYDAANMLLDSTTLMIAGSFTGLMTLSLSHAGIAYAIFGSGPPSNNGSSVFADNFTFTSGTTVPEPATLALLALGLGGLGFLRRRN